MFAGIGEINWEIEIDLWRAASQTLKLLGGCSKMQCLDVEVTCQGSMKDNQNGYATR